MWKLIIKPAEVALLESPKVEIIIIFHKFYMSEKLAKMRCEKPSLFAWRLIGFAKYNSLRMANC